ncbi:MAG: pyrroloquinoline quinone-dependent dehydrogenase [Bryobacterales bacterium]|nr:pyrroloquinoline quinone-dependent dehydrogenase [Bryobacterales bacterium]
MPSNRRAFLKSTGGAIVAASRAWPVPGPRPWISDEPDREWRHYGGTAGAARYSAADRIVRSNVAMLKPAWIHRTGDAMQRPQTTIECTPIVVDGVMYITTARLKVQALSAATGKLLWTFDPLDESAARRSAGVNRGVCYWQSEDGAEQRIFSTVQNRLHSLNAATGVPDPSFGAEGMVDLNNDLDSEVPGVSVKCTSPVVAFKDLIVVGGGGGEGPYPQAPGHIRAYDAMTGKRRWIFHTTPRPGQFGYDTWPPNAYRHVGGTNNWSGMSLDVERGIVFAGIGSPAFDFYGGDRIGANLFGNCVLALDAATGKRVWHFQTVHHDVWDYDLPAQPALIRMTQNGRTFDAVVQPTKQGFLFFFHRETGRPVWPVEERPIPMSDVGGEQLWPTQPFPVKPRPLSRQGFHAKDISDISEESRAAVKKIWDATDAGDLFTPPSTRGTLVHPGFRGGCLWGGCCYNPAMNRVFASSDETTNRIELKLAPQEAFDYALPDRSEFLDHEGYPAIKPPWGYVTAVDLESGDFAWRVVNGEFAELTAHGIPKTGTPSHGGSIATAGGLVFMAGTFDKKFRAFDQDNGEVLWESELKAGGFATPCTYEADGKQFGVIAAGGGKGNTASGDEIVAFSIDS